MKHIMKYVAIFMAVILSATIIGSCVTLAVELARALAGKSNGASIVIDGEEIWIGSDEVISNEDGVVEIFGIRLNGSNKVKSGTVTEINPEEVYRLYIESSSCALSIEEGDSYLVEYENIPEDYVFEVALGSLNIKREPSVFQFGSVITKQPKICVTVPRGTVFDKVEIDNGSGSVIVADIETEVLIVDSGSGAVRLQGINAGDTALDTGSGAFQVWNAKLGETRVDSGSGSVVFEEVAASNLVAETGSGRISYNGVLTGNCVFDTGSGSVNLELTGAEEDYNIRADLGSGGLYINGKRSEDESIKYNNASNLLVFDTGSGRVSVKFSEPATK